MTQRIFDIENEKDMQDLWDILPIEITKLYHESDCIEEKTANIERFIKINWHDATEITRPMDYKSMVGCVGWFSNKEEDKKYCFGIFDIYDDKDESNDGKNFHCSLIGWYKYFTPAKKSELKFWEGVE